jgi:hypothetical protein
MKLVSTAFVKAQKEFSPVLKTHLNPHFKSRYADLASCVEAVIDALNNNGIALMQKLHEKPDGIAIETIFVHESGESMANGILFFPAPKHDPQGFMSCLTYIRRASLMTACGIAAEDDDGNAASRKKEIKSTINESEMADYMAAMDECVTIEALQKAFTQAIAATDGDTAWQKVLIGKKDQLKKKLGGSK